MTLSEIFSNRLSQNPRPCLTITLLVCLESSTVIGLLIPSLIPLPSSGSLSTHGLFDFWDQPVCALIGVVFPGSISYWLGCLGYGVLLSIIMLSNARLK